MQRNTKSLCEAKSPNTMAKEGANSLDAPDAQNQRQRSPRKKKNRTRANQEPGLQPGSPKPVSESPTGASALLASQETVIKGVERQSNGVRVRGILNADSWSPNLYSPPQLGTSIPVFGSPSSLFASYSAQDVRVNPNSAPQGRLSMPPRSVSFTGPIASYGYLARTQSISSNLFRHGNISI